MVDSNFHEICQECGYSIDLLQCECFEEDIDKEIKLR